MSKVLNKKQKRFFNLVEITLCLGVVAIGVSGVMSLFPIGFQATKSAIGETYSAYAANQFLAYLTRNCNNPTKSYGSGARDFWEEFVFPAPSSEIPETIPSETDESAATFSLASGDTMIYSSDYPGLYRIKQGTTNITDFHATVRIWRSKIQNLYISNQNISEIDYLYAVKFRVEVSWPVEKPYSKREKRYYCVEVFRQQF